MKKSVSIVIAILLTLAAVFTVSVAAFAAEIVPTTAGTTKAAEAPAIAVPTTAAVTVTTTANARENFQKEHVSQVEAESSAKKAEEDASKALAELSSQVAALTTKSVATIPNSTQEDNAPVVTNAPGQTAIYDEPDNTAAAGNGGAKSGTKKAAAVSTRVPNTGSNAAIPAFAVLALLAGTVAVVKTKKSEV